MSRRPWSHYAAPAVFLLAVTIAVLVARAALDSRSGASPATPTSPLATASTTATAARTPATTARTSTARTSTAKRAPAVRYYTVIAGDTFGVISAKTGVSVARIEQLNANVSSNTLFIGQKIRIR